MNKWLSYCVKKARQLESGPRYKMYAVVTKGGSVLSEGHNLSAHDYPGSAVNDNMPEWSGLHAEMSCLKKLPQSTRKGTTLYVAGVSVGGNILHSRPCTYCWEVILEAEVSKVCWLDPNGEYTFRRL